MADNSLKNPWIFTVVVVVVWILVWGGVELLLFDDDPTGAVITGAVSGLAFALFYTIFRRQIE